MSATITLNADGNQSLGSLRAELITVTPAANDYATGGYPLTAGASGNVGMSKILFVEPIGSPGGFNPSWNTATGKVQMLGVEAAAVATFYAMTEAPPATNIPAFQCWVIGL